MAINCLGKTKRWEQAVKVFERMSTDLGHAPDSMTHSLVINSLALVRPTAIAWPCLALPCYTLAVCACCCCISILSFAH